ncbi:Phospholipase A2 family protein isoform 1 [Hibiscus syriacus]|uniref:Phospholipase A2 family protein isoform 1 n=1 Tax=Hibiscus syriacus TaxID=106335 RepID=A0A6A3B5B2_HIBSY|nr:Phospholipase A2 family protein isoform 1 [Hibiscus syriacus]
MNFGFLSIPWFDVDPKRDSNLSFASIEPKQKTSFEIRVWGWTLVSVPPKAVNGNDRNRTPTTINKGLKRRAQQNQVIEPPAPIRFRPYVCKVPWHTGARAFLSQLFPRYGHYCGPNWSSGKDGRTSESDLAFLECLERRHMSTRGDPHIAQLYMTMCTTVSMFVLSALLNEWQVIQMAWQLRFRTMFCPINGFIGVDFRG